MPNISPSSAPSPSLRTMAMQFVELIGTRFAGKIINLVTIILLARCLSVDEYGTFGLYLTSIGLATTFGSLGIRQGLAYLIGKKKISLSMAWGISIILSLPLAILCIAGTWLAIGLHLQFFTVESALALTSLACFFSIWVQIGQGFNLGQGQMRLFNILDVAPFAFLLLFLLTVWLPFGINYHVAILAIAAGQIITGLIVITGLFTRLRFNGHNILGNCISLLRHGVPYGFTLFLILVTGWTNLYLLKWMDLPIQAGHFFAATQMLNVIIMVAVSIGMVFFSHGVRHEDPKLALSQIARITSVLFWLMMIAGFLAGALAPWLVPFFLGAAHTPTVPVLQILLIGLSAASLPKMLYPTLASVAGPQAGLPLILPGLIVSFLFGWIGIRIGGEIGAAWGTVFTQCFLAAGYLWQINRRYGFSPFIFLFPQRRDICRLYGTFIKLLKKIIIRK